jgi:hypothetical protein
MNEYIEVKNNSGTKVRYENVEAISLPTTNGERVLFRKWNGISGLTSSSSV